jgi:hypothetical protein
MAMAPAGVASPEFGPDSPEPTPLISPTPLKFGCSESEDVSIKQSTITQL